MVKIKSLFILLPYFVLAGLCLSFSSPTEQCDCAGKTVKEKGSAIIQGKVTSGQNSVGMKGVNLCLLKNGVLIAKTKSGKNGNYSFSSLSGGKYEVKACAKNSLNPVVISGINVNPAKTEFINVFIPPN